MMAARWPVWETRPLATSMSGKFMRHVKLRPGMSTNDAALSRLIEAAYEDIKARVEHG